MSEKNINKENGNAIAKSSKEVIMKLIIQSIKFILLFIVFLLVLTIVNVFTKQFLSFDIIAGIKESFVSWFS